MINFDELLMESVSVAQEKLNEILPDHTLFEVTEGDEVYWIINGPAIKVKLTR